MSQAPFIVTCSIGHPLTATGQPHLQLMELSCEKYAPASILEVFYNQRGKNFGTAFNEAVEWVRREYPEAERIIIANDDVVLRPDTMKLICEDADSLDAQGITWGHIAARFDRGAQTLQNLRHNPFEALPMIFEERWIAPVFSMVHRDRWIDFPAINWGSDVIQCHDMRAAGMKIFVSRAYVHHVGGITCGENALADRELSKEWLLQYRPELVNLI